ncbi:MAG: serine--tRNA ligase [Alphaproteobacteria bacterium]
MFDPKFIRDNPKAFDEGLERRGLGAMSKQVLDLDARRRAAQTAMQELRQRRNEASKQIGLRKAKGEDASELIDEVASLKDRLQEAEEEERDHARALDELLSGLPNLPADDVPVGPDETANVVMRTVGEKPAFDFEPREHFDVGAALGMDFERAAKMSGARFVVMTGPLARLERALAAFMLDLHTGEFGYVEAYVPRLVRDEALFGTGQLPKFGDDLFRTTDGFWLIPTAEVSLTNLVAGEILDEANLPLRFTAYTSCFRSEAGAAGKDTRGMIRQHQFGKVELVSIVHPDRSDEELERMTSCAEEVLKRLGIAYQVVLLSTGDMGFAARKTYDTEVWLPGQNAYREISSCSNCGDFQARRMKARFRPAGEKGTRFVHTLNGSGLAVGRTLIAILETYQRADGSVDIPEPLRPYMGGLERLLPHE